jgi:predicted nucleic acid-binding protein
MAKDGRLFSIIETSVLINFLRINRVDLLARHPTYRFVVIDYVRREITNRSIDQQTQLEAALKAGLLLGDIDPKNVSLAELQAYADLQSVKIGDGERGAIAAAFARGYAIAINDYRALKRLPATYKSLHLEDTASIMVALIRAGVLTVAEADVIKADWESNHRFRLTFTTFGELI